MKKFIAYCLLSVFVLPVSAQSIGVFKRLMVNEDVFIGGTSQEDRAVRFSDRNTPMWNADRMNGIDVSGDPADGQFLKYDAASNNWIPGGIPMTVVELQKVTDAGNLTTNAIQITGMGGVNYLENSLLLGVETGYPTIGYLYNGDISAGMAMSENQVSFGFIPSNALTIINPSINNGLAAHFNGRVQGHDAQVESEYVTLNQLNSRIQLGAEYAGTADLQGTGPTEVITVNTPVVTDKSIIMLTVQECANCNITPVVSSRLPYESFTITCSKDEGTTGKIAWMIFEPLN